MVWGPGRAISLAGGLCLAGVVGNAPNSDVFDLAVGVAGSGAFGSVGEIISLAVAGVRGFRVGALCAASIVGDTGATGKILFIRARGTSAWSRK